MRAGQEGLTDFASLVAELQSRVLEQARELYSARVVEEAYNPKNVGRMADPDACGVVHGWCGDTMEFYLRVNGGRIGEATFVTDGCGPTIACGSMLTAMVQGMSLEEAGEVHSVDLIEALGGLPEESIHCAELAVRTLRAAVADCLRADRDNENGNENEHERRGRSEESNGG
jgi:nitrogen fixation NifU-like protein